MNLILFDDLKIRTNLLPLTFTRPVGNLRLGTFTINEKWERYYNCTVGYATEPYLQTKFPNHNLPNSMYVNGAVHPTEPLLQAISSLPQETVLMYQNYVIAHHAEADIATCKTIEYAFALNLIKNLWDITTLNEWAIEQDFEYFKNHATRIELMSCNTCTDPESVFVEQGATVLGSSLNTQGKKIILRNSCEMMEGTHVRGAFALGVNAQTKLLTKIYGATSIGDGCKVGGELNNVVLQANSSKAHDGFLGNAVIGEWCNLGADSNNSNLKNNYAEVKLWNYGTGKFENTGLQFFGLVMGDHAKCGINTMFNTGTVVGVSANVFGAGFPRNFIHDFAWGGPQGISTYRLNDALDTMARVLARRNIALTENDKNSMQHIFDATQIYRKE